ncbi:MAG: hypothetical protein V7603_6072 [Micromonosporaceae bacterium]
MFTRIAALALGAAVLTGAAGCGSTGTDTMTPEATALTALGYQTEDLVPAANPSASPDATGRAHPRARRLALRRALRGNVEHGEVVVKTKDGEKTVDIQRGTVTAINATTVTVRSADGFTLTWTFGHPIHVIEHRTSVQPSNVTVGEEIGVAGTKNGSTPTAQLILIPKAK